MKNCWTACRFVRVILVQNAMESQVQTGMNCGMIAANHSSHSSSEICSRTQFFAFHPSCSFTTIWILLLQLPKTNIVNIQNKKAVATQALF